MGPGASRLCVCVTADVMDAVACVDAERQQRYSFRGSGAWPAALKPPHQLEHHPWHNTRYTLANARLRAACSALSGSVQAKHFLLRRCSSLATWDGPAATSLSTNKWAVRPLLLRFRGPDWLSRHRRCRCGIAAARCSGGRDHAVTKIRSGLKGRLHAHLRSPFPAGARVRRTWRADM